MIANEGRVRVGVNLAIVKVAQIRTLLHSHSLGSRSIC